MLIETTRYELPPEGITLLGYIVRRMHKTEWLTIAHSLLEERKFPEALEYISLYAAASSTSYGRAFYQPAFNQVGDVIHEADPATKAVVTAKLETTSPYYFISYEAIMPNGDTFKGSESITGTTIGLRGLGMPTPSKFTFASGNYLAEFEGIITSELALSLFGNTRIRAYGSLNITDNLGNKGMLELNRAGDISIKLNGQPAVHHSTSMITWINTSRHVLQPS